MMERKLRRAILDRYRSIGFRLEIYTVEMKNDLTEEGRHFIHHGRRDITLIIYQKFLNEPHPGMQKSHRDECMNGYDEISTMS